MADDVVTEAKLNMIVNNRQNTPRAASSRFVWSIGPSR